MSPSFNAAECLALVRALELARDEYDSMASRLLADRQDDAARAYLDRRDMAARLARRVDEPPADEPDEPDAGAATSNAAKSVLLAGMGKGNVPW